MRPLSPTLSRVIVDGELAPARSPPANRFQEPRDPFLRAHGANLLRAGTRIDNGLTSVAPREWRGRLLDDPGTATSASSSTLGCLADESGEGFRH